MLRKKSNSRVKEILKFEVLNSIFFCFHRLQFNLNEKYLSQLEKVNDRLNKLEQLLQGDDNTNVFAKLDQLEDKMAQLNLEQKEKAEELNNNVSDNNTRLSALEGQNYDQQMDLNEIKDELKAKEDSESTEKMMQDFMAKLQSDNLDTLSKRIDSNENHIKLLEEKDDQLDGDMERVNENIINIDGRLGMTILILKDESYIYFKMIVILQLLS